MTTDIVTRTRNILLSPRTEWQVIACETETLGSMLVKYVLPMSLVPILTSIARGYIYGTGMPEYLVPIGILFISLGTFLLFTLAFEWLSNPFNSEKNLGRSAQLVAYGFTANTLFSVLTLVPEVGRALSFIGLFITLYSLYVGLGPMKNTPEDKKIPYIVAVFAVMIALAFVVGIILYGALLASAA